MSASDIQHDLAPTLNFNVDSPIDFRIWDEEQDSNIYVDGGGSPHKHILALWNQDTENRSINFHPSDNFVHNVQNQSLDEFFRSNHHLELRFRVGTLSQAVLDEMAAILETQIATTLQDNSTSDSWYVHPCKSSSSGEILLYLLATKQKTLTTGANDILKVPLPHIAIDVRSGVNVVPVELRPGPLVKRSDGARVIGPRITHLEVLSERGRKYFPMVFSIEGSNTVINDGESVTNLVLRIANVDDGDMIQLSKKEPKITHFILTCELALPSDHYWALTDERKKVQLFLRNESSGIYDPEKEGFWQTDAITSATNGKTLEWVVDTKMLGTDEFWNHQSFYLRLAVQTKMRTGPTDIHLHYRNVPGYQDDKRTCTIFKTPLHFIRTDKGLDFAGLGTTAPDGKLHVKVDKHNAAIFEGGGGVDIKNVTGKKNALYVYDNKTKYPTAWFGNNGSGATLYAKQEGKGKAGMFVGDVEVTGNVGIGDAKSLAKLSIGSGSLEDKNLPVQMSANNKIAYFAVNRADGEYGAVFGWDSAYGGVTIRSINANDKINLVVKNTTKAMTLLPSGDVGIGKENPVSKLHIEGGDDASLNTHGYVVLGKTNKTNLVLDDNEILARNNGAVSTLHLQNDGGNLAISASNSKGRVGIGVSNPTKATLEIAGVGVSKWLKSIYLHKDANHYWSPGGNADAEIPLEDYRGGHTQTLSIYAAHDVAASGFASHSDARIKNIEGQSDSTADLSTLRAIEVTDYTYKDIISKGMRPHKKIIAQQVESVYPQAVSRRKEAVPDIYQKAIVNDGWIELDTDLKTGDRVRLIIEDSDDIYIVLEVREGAFRPSELLTTDELFVFGREVDDFCLVDYDAISMLNVSATQALTRQLESKDAEIADLTARLAALEARDRAYEARLTRLEQAAALTDLPKVVAGYKSVLRESN